MTRPKDKPSYRTVRTDIFRHTKTRGMRAASYALKLYAMAQNILGIVRESPKSIASNFEGMTVKELQLAIRCMVIRGVARWWPELDILWIVECLDEQSFSTNTDISAGKIYATLPAVVQEAVSQRYGARVTGRGIPKPLPQGVRAGVGGTQKSRRAEENSPTTTTTRSGEHPPHARAAVVVAAPPQAPAGTRSGRVYSGRIASSGEIAELDLWRRQCLADLPASERAAVPGFTRDVAELGPGLAAALDEHGPDTVRRVVAWAVAECAAGRLRREHFIALFNGDAFSRRLAECSVPAARDIAAEHEQRVAEERRKSAERREAEARAREAGR